VGEGEVFSRRKIEVCPHLGDDDACSNGHGGGPNVVLEPVAGEGTADGGGDVRQARLVETCDAGVAGPQQPLT